MSALLKNVLVMSVLLATTACGAKQFEPTASVSTSPSSSTMPTISSSPVVNIITNTPTATSTAPSSPTVSTKTSNSTTLKKYSNETTGLSIQYPSNSRVVEDSKTSNSSSFIVSNIPDSKETPGTKKWLEFQKSLPSDAYSVEVLIGERTEESKLSSMDYQGDMSENSNSGLATLPKPKMVSSSLPWNICGGSVIPANRYVVDGTEGFGGELIVTAESAGFYGNAYCFKKNKVGDDTHYYQVLIRINEKDPLQKLNKLLFPTIRFK